VEDLQKQLLSSITPAQGLVRAQIGSFVEETTIALQHLEVAFTTLQHALCEGEAYDGHVQVPQEIRETLALHQLTELATLLRRQEQSGLEKLAQIEAQIAQTQEQVATLVLREIQTLELRYEQRLTAFATALTKALERVSAGQSSQGLNVFGKTRKRRLAAAVEYAASGRYVLINQTASEVLVAPNSAEWFTWLASLSAFHFQGRSGRFTARHEEKKRRDEQAPLLYWYAYRKGHNQQHKRYLGMTEKLTTTHLEQVAVALEGQMKQF
jgi:hypothetical protein